MKSVTLTLCCLLVFAGLLTSPLYAQGCGLTTTFASNNGQEGNMFDVKALNPNGVTITGFDVNIDGSPMMEVWYRPGTYLGFETFNAGWTQVGGPVQVTSNGADVPMDTLDSNAN